MFVHHVFFWLKPGSGEAERQQLIEGLKGLTHIDLIRQWHIGTPADTHREVVERSYAVSWLNIFDSAADEAAYQHHPTHLQFIESCKHLWEKVVVYDSI